MVKRRRERAYTNNQLMILKNTSIETKLQSTTIPCPSSFPRLEIFFFLFFCNKIAKWLGLWFDKMSSVYLVQFNDNRKSFRNKLQTNKIADMNKKLQNYPRMNCNRLWFFDFHSTKHKCFMIIFDIKNFYILHLFDHQLMRIANNEIIDFYFFILQNIDFLQLWFWVEFCYFFL